jgi:hypothetical protein
MESINPSSNQELLTREQTEIIQELVNCALACEACSAACLNEKENAHMMRCIELTRDCADSCFQAARFIMRKSEIADQYLTICEEACKICAEECRKHNHDHCELCAEACESCSESCNAYYHGETKEK